ncbi:MAG TPA: FAD-dependent oxidoreductase [Candidatus Acidoferrum sp.]|nr:FAD-dependent oxidoreductase [Candidatus Acidoferrum sp.]
MNRSDGSPTLMNSAGTTRDPSFDLCVVGAGISGLSLAHYAGSAGLRVLLLEKSGEPGGCFASAIIDGPCNSRGWLELGAHTCYNSYLNFVSLLEDLQLLGQTCPRRGLGFRVMDGGELRTIASCLDYWELFRSLPQLIFERRKNNTVNSFYSHVIGRKNCQRVLIPMLNAVASQDTRDFPADELLKWRHERRKDVYRSFAISGGLQSVASALVKNKNITSKFGIEVSSVEQRREHYVVESTRGETFHGKAVAVATPPDQAAHILTKDFSGVADLLSKIEIRRVRSIGLIFRGELPAIPRVAGIVLPEGPCFSAVSSDAFSVAGKRAFAFHFNGDSEGGEGDLEHACRILGVSRRDVESVRVTYHYLPALRQGHAELVIRLDKQLWNSDVLLVGNYLGGLSIEDCVSRSRSEYQRLSLS